MREKLATAVGDGNVQALPGDEPAWKDWITGEDPEASAFASFSFSSAIR